MPGSPPVRSGGRQWWTSSPTAHAVRGLPLPVGTSASRPLVKEAPECKACERCHDNDGGTMTQAEEAAPSAPVLPYIFNPGQAPALTFFERNDRLQEQARPV